MKIKLRYKIVTIIVTLLSVFLYGRCSRPKPIVTSPLPKDVLVRITVDPDKHHVRIEQPTKKTIDTFLPDRQSTFEVKTDGTVKVSSSQWGLEHHFFFGVFMSDEFRLGAGIDGFYWKKLDLGVGVACQVGNHTPVIYGKVSYLVYNSVQLGITYDNMQHVGGSLTIRI